MYPVKPGIKHILVKPGNNQNSWSTELEITWKSKQKQDYTFLGFCLVNQAISWKTRYKQQATNPLEIPRKKIYRSDYQEKSLEF